jgi:hypothetical protein
MVIASLGPATNTAPDGSMPAAPRAGDKRGKVLAHRAVSDRAGDHRRRPVKQPGRSCRVCGCGIERGEVDRSVGGARQHASYHNLAVSGVASFTSL